MAGSLHGIATTVEGEDERVAHLTDRGIRWRPDLADRILHPVPQRPIAPCQPDDGVVRAVGDRGVDRRGYPVVVDDAARPAAVPVQCSRLWRQRDRLLGPVQQIWGAGVPP